VRSSFALFVGALGCLAVVTPAVGQDSALLLEMNVGAAVPMSSFADGTETGQGAESGVAFGLGFTLPRSERVALYLGFDQQRFGCEPAGCSEGGTYVATGFDVGVRFALLTGTAVVPWIRVAGITTRVETRDLPDPNQGVSELGFGFEAGAGALIGTSRIGVNPMVTYSSVNSDLPGGDSLGLRYLTASVGLVVPF
jgi:hypothetical protein